MGKRQERDLRDAVRDRGFTPSVRDLAPLLELLGEPDEELADGAERALLRLGPPLLPTLLGEFPASRAPKRGRLCRVIGRLGIEGAEGREFLLAALEDADAKTQRNAAGALGRVHDPRAEDALLRFWQAGSPAPLLRTVAASLGKIGSDRAREALRTPPVDDAELARIAARATLMVERTLARETPSSIVGERAPAVPTRIAFWCRAGLEELVVDELGAAWQPRIAGRGRVEGVLAGPLASAWSVRTALGFALPLSPQRIGPRETVADAAVRALAGDEAHAVLARWTDGPLRYRIAVAGEGHRRALVWECARRVAERRPAMRNDPTRSPWEARIAERRGTVWVELVPRALPDPRFLWRVADVPAASHPTLAAALARLGGQQPTDVVWDPFAGCGAELIERARLGPAAALVGTDLDPRALEAARRNALAAGVRLELAEADGTSYVPRQAPTLILTNPPMGRRVVHHRELPEMLDRFVAHAAEVLCPGGRLVWISPRPDDGARRAAACGLRLDFEREVDMGGFTARIQRFRKRD